MSSVEVVRCCDVLMIRLVIGRVDNWIPRICTSNAKEKDTLG